MQNQQPQVNLDLTKTTAVDLPSGGKIWQSGVILRRISKFVTGTSEDGLIPIPIFYDPNTYYNLITRKLDEPTRALGC